MIKRLLTSVVMFLCSLFTFAQFSGSGNGTESDPYLIFDEGQLAQLANFLNQEDVVFKLMNNLDLTDWISENNPHQGWLPIGVESAPFKGKFYGNSHSINGLMINRSETNYVGFFGYVMGATIENLTIEGTSVTGDSNVGGFVGYATSSNITNCHIVLTGTPGVNGNSNVGGFVGYSDDTNYGMFSCLAQVNSSGKLGGFAGSVDKGTFTNGSISGAVNCTGGYAGGFVGWISNGSATNITVKSDIVGQNYTGGFAGYSSNCSYKDCAYYGTLTGQSYVGGLSGSLEKATSSFEDCFTKGKITSSGNYAGGLIGVSKGACIEKMENCSHFGDISGNSYVGGLVGAVLSAVEAPVLHTYETRTSRTYSSGSHRNWYYETISTGSSVEKCINNCTAIGNVNGQSFVGGLIGSETTANGYTQIEECWTESYYYVFEGEKLVYDGRKTYYKYSRNTISISLKNSYYSGTISGIEDVGGLYGYKSGGTIQNNYAYANVCGSSNVGGIVGILSDGKIDNSYNTTTVKSNVANNTVISATSSDVGRIFGKADMEHVVIGALATAEGNRALTQTRVLLCGVVQEVDDDLQNGTSIGPTALRLKANYVSWGWDFDNNWNILETECYPYKKYQAAPPIIESNLVSKATSINGNSINGGTVYLYYKDREPVSTECDGNNWTFNTEALQSGAQVQIYADVDGMTPSYFTTTTVGYPGSGTENDPWRIYTAEDLQGASNRGYYKVMNDIDLTSWIDENSPTAGWPAIGRNSGEATYIDGNGHTVSGLWTNTTDNYTGLFSNFSAGQIKNLTVEVATGKTVKGGDYTGILIGRNANGSIVNCTVKGDVEGTVHTGGVVGYAESTTLKTINHQGLVSSNADDSYVGGIAGQMVGCTVTLCRSSASVSASGANCRAGGLAGHAKEGSISKSFTNTTLTTTGAANYVGGLVGYSETPVSQSVSTGTVSATGENSYSGGLIGYTVSPVSNCYSTANTTGTWFTAGLVGYTFSTIDKCYAKGNVYGVYYGGGVVGELDGLNASLTNSVACNNILSLSAQSSWGSRVIGGFKNGAADPDKSNYALNTMQVSLNNVPQAKKDNLVEGFAKTNIELMTKSTYQALGWDMSDIWNIDDEMSYPYLKNVEGNGSGNTEPEDPDPGNIPEPSENIEVTDISTLTNAIYVTPTSALKGSEGTLIICLKNSNATSAYSFELKLPNGVSVESYTLSDRHNGHGDMMNYQESTGIYSFAVLSLNSKEVAGNDGAIWTLKLNIPSNMEVGSYPIEIKNAKYSLTSGSTSVWLPETTSVLVIEDSVKGDANGDGSVDIADAVCIVNHVVGKATPAFVEKAADANGDGSVDIADAVRIVNLVVGKISALARQVDYSLPEPE